MSPILTLQRQLREIGRIRTGNTVAAGRGKRPNKLDTFRLTSASRELVDAAAAAFGGTVVPWDNNGRPEFEVITTAASMDIVVPPGQPVSQWYELWSAGGCARRCDGVTEQLTEQPCLCPADIDVRTELAGKGEACKATTRLNVILPQLPDLGVWRLESHGYYAAVELAGAAEILAMASELGRLIPAKLRLEQRSKQEPGKPTKKYAVPVIELGVLVSQLNILGPAGDEPSPQLVAGADRPQLPATTLPAGSDFRATSEAPGRRALDDVANDATPDADGQPGQTDGTEGDPDEPVGRRAIDHSILVASLKLADIPLEDAIARSLVLFPRDKGVPLTDEQRAELLADLTAAPAAAL